MAMLWVTMTEVRWCCRCSLSMSEKTMSAVRLSRSPVGSSARRSLGLRDQGTGEGDTLLFAAGEFAGAMGGPAPKFDFVQPVLRGSEGLSLRFAPGKQRHGDVLQRGEFRQEVMELPDVADFAVAKSGGLSG